MNALLGLPYVLRRDYRLPRADALQLTSCGLWNNEAHKDEGQDAEHPEDDKGQRIARGFNKGQKRERNQKIRSAETQCGGSNPPAAQPQGKYLGDQDPCNGTDTEGIAGDERHEARGGYDAQRLA